ncbi:MAG: O-antigen ligase family protein, partial [Candidatus Brocadiales bacterium]|nr:O-antigen ligase family protein [Candidatus Bathyanammoxibius sp.]
LFIGWLALARRDTILLEPIIILAFLGSELLTGSRTGIVLGVVIVGIHLVYQWREKLFRSRKVRNLSARLAVLVVCVFFGLMGMKFFVEIYGTHIDRNPGDLIDRMNTLLELNLSGREDLEQDTSFQRRISAQRVYWRLIKDKPLVGHGFGTEALYLRHGVIHLTSHSTMLFVTMEYGIFYPLLFSILLMTVFLSRHRAPVQQALGTNAVTQFVLVSLLVFVVGGGLLLQRAFFVVFGMVYLAAYYPWRVFAYDASTRTYTGMLSKGEIRQAQRNQGRNSRPEAADGAETEAVDAKSDETTTS